MKFQRFTDSRWCTVGDSGATLFRACLVGFQGLAQAVRKDPKCGDYYTTGFELLSNEVLRYAMIASVTSHIADPVLLQLLGDDRVPRNLPQLQQAVKENLLW
eukprot:5374033-Lingulodinium_polyedra.AAC.1